MPVAAIASPGPAPAVRLAASSIAGTAAVRAVIARVPSGVVLVVRFRVSAATGSDSSGCDVSASRRVSGSNRPMRVALAPRGIWCAGVGVLTLLASRHEIRTVAARLRIRAAEALGQGDVVGQLLLGPTCPVERVADPCDPVAHPDPVSLVASDTTGREISRTMTLADGSFALDLPSGSYTLHAEPRGASYPSIPDTTVIVTGAATPSRPARVLVTGDTGIR